MKKIICSTFTIFTLLIALTVYSGSKDLGEKCMGDADCEFDADCRGGVCIKKKPYDYGYPGKSWKTGKDCDVDSDCIGSGECVEGSFGKKNCSGI